MTALRLPKAGEVWTSKLDPSIKLKVTEARQEVDSPALGWVWFDQTGSANEAPTNFTDTLFSFLRAATPPDAEPDEAIQVIEAKTGTVEQLLAEMTPDENDAANRAARTAAALHEMLRLTNPTAMEAMTCCVSLLLEVTEHLKVDINQACELIKGTHARLVQFRAEKAAADDLVERASEAS
jgi:mannose/cellobiose epimerase-like protein (N-acyl-D-glucosamine 2-epimerase family)